MSIDNHQMYKIWYWRLNNGKGFTGNNRYGQVIE